MFVLVCEVKTVWYTNNSSNVHFYLLLSFHMNVFTEFNTLKVLLTAFRNWGDGFMTVACVAGTLV